jgi:hypothetical protein
MRHAGCTSMHRDFASLPRHKSWLPPPSTSILWHVAYKVTVLLHSIINHFACGWQVLLTKAGASLRRSFHAPGLCSGEREGLNLKVILLWEGRFTRSVRAPSCAVHYCSYSHDEIVQVVGGGARLFHDARTCSRTKIHTCIGRLGRYVQNLLKTWC